MRARLTRILLAVACAGSVLSCTDLLPTEPEATALLGLTVPHLEVSYNPDSAKVLCSWTPPADPRSFYRLYRAVVTRGGDEPKLVTEGPRSRIPGHLTSYYDVVGLENAQYRYAIRAVRIKQIDSVETTEGTVYDTQYVEGPGSPQDTCWVGTGISFSINDGALFTRYDTCSLYIVDRNDVLVSAELSADSVFSAPISVVLETQSIVTTVPWTLAPGPGTKFAYARLHYRAGGDTVIPDDIEIEPYDVELKLRNETRKPMESMRVWYAIDGQGIFSSLQGRPIDQYVVYRPFVQFGVSIFSDSSFAREFSYALVFADNAALVAGGEVVKIRTRMKTDSLTGIGSAHDDFHRYGYSFDPDSIPGRTNLSELCFIVGDTAETTMPFGPQDAYSTLVAMPYNEIRGSGKKEFYIYAAFKGRYFGEDRIVKTSGFISTSSSFASYYDAYPPYCWRDAFEYYYPVDGATIEGAFRINLNEDGDIYGDDGGVLKERGYIGDRGGADVAAIELIIAEMPDAMAAEWDPAVTPASLTLDSILSFRHRVFPFEIGARKSDKIYPVYWNSIDPTGWNSGWYLITIVTEDSFGNRGIAPFEHMFRQGSNFNPQHWRIITGQAGL
ncbi:MAG: hypothetical protein GF331_01585 [Chitinivibrionales bacterium]|nr:hypothetical protein [Chitinivibrionales bacterium]